MSLALAATAVGLLAFGIGVVVGAWMQRLDDRVRERRTVNGAPARWEWWW